ncbi:DUF1800 domain-containing protein [Rubrivirga marina]|uniref:DUF1800 domain-containing protein n=1 Tax=Rubrivirga marina TaxID=1196024 RepID=A0A271J2C5_9BACT|nr:DUF1800 domain-containing protein [Rubrivirga marina]PAP77671.1 hypothetical protein BSZ37_15090 [Rubrivirga marina]
MDRRAFFRPSRRSGAPPLFEVLPGVFADGSRVRWDYAAARPAPLASARTASRSPLPAAADLSPYAPSDAAPWDARRARHLLRRTGVAAMPVSVEWALSGSPTETVDAILDGALALGPTPRPLWYNRVPPHWSEPSPIQDAFWDENWQWHDVWRDDVLRDLMGVDDPEPGAEAARAFRHRLTVMWHNHFVTHFESYNLAPWLARYWRTLERHALGDIRAFVHEVGLSPAMLVYLNGADNRAEAPNENYARELLELFTTGITGPDGAPNYTQADITEISRALTGYGVDFYGQTPTPLEAVFVPDWHDDGEKTILGQTGPWGYDDVVRIVFEERAPQIAHRVAALLYREFVYDVPHPEVVSALAGTILADDFVVEGAVRQLLRSAHFFDAATLGARVRSPLEHNVGAYREVGARPSPDDDFLGAVWWMMHLEGQSLFKPPTVAGWPGGRDWLDTGRLATRWEYTSWVQWWNVDYRALALTMPEPWNAAALAADLADALLGVPLPQDEKAALTELLLNGLPPYEWSPITPGAESRIRGLVAHLFRLPEFQLS